MGLFKKIGKAIGKAANFVGKKVLKPGLSFASKIISDSGLPGGKLIGGGLGIVSNALPTAKASASVGESAKVKASEAVFEKVTFSGTEPKLDPAQQLVFGGDLKKEVDDVIETVSDSVTGTEKKWYEKVPMWAWFVVAPVGLVVLFWVGKKLIKR